MFRFIIPLLICLLIPLSATAERKGRYQRSGGMDVYNGDLTVAGGFDLILYDAGTLVLGTGGISGALGLSGTDTFIQLGTGVHTLTTTGAFLRDGTGTTAFTSSGAWSHSGSGVMNLSSTGTLTKSGVGLTVFSGGDISLTGADTDLTLDGATTDVRLTAGGDVVVSSTGSVDVTGTGSYDFGGNKFYDCDTVTVSTGELLALNATPKTLVAAPGANLFVSVHYAVLALDYNSAAYAGVAANEDLTIAYTNGSGADVLPPIETTGFIDQTNDEIRVTYATGTVVAAGAATAPTIPVSNAPVVLSMDTAEVITGDSPLDVYICYSILPDLLD